MNDHRAEKAAGATLSSRLIDHRRPSTDPGLGETTTRSSKLAPASPYGYDERRIFLVRT